MLDERVRDRAAFLANDWRKILEQERSRAPAPDNPMSELVERMLNALGEARSPFSKLSSAIAPHGTRFESPDPGAGMERHMPQGARLALELRDGFTQFAVLRALRANAGAKSPVGLPTASSWKGVLDRLESLAGANATPALRPAGPGTEVESGFAWADYAASDNAERFFNGTLKDMLEKMDERLGTRLSMHASRPYAKDDGESVDRWSRLWTAAVAIVAADWIRARGCQTEDPSADDLADALWRGIKNTRGAPLKLYPGNAVLPTSKKVAPGLQISLSLPTLPAQALDYSDERWIDDEADLRQPIRIRIHELNLQWRNGEALYRALNGGQLYLAILAACLDGTASRPVLSAPQQPTIGAVPAQLTAQQVRCVDAIDRRRRAPAAREARAGNRFLESSARTQGAESIAKAPSGSGPIWDGGLDFQAAPETGESPDGTARIGSIDLWSNLPESFGWIDVLFVAERPATGERWILPIELEDAPEQESPSEGEDSDEPPRHSLWLTDMPAARASRAELRQALASPGRTHWHYEYAGLGVFVVALVEL